MQHPPKGAVFLSYASQDAGAAQRICDALRAVGIEVWFDQSELRGGDVWDQRIRREIRECALFIPVISKSTAARHEGYFRLEWDLADQRSHMMARDRAFIIPVCLDAAPGAGTDVPESFHRVQWMRLPGGETSPQFVERIRRLLSPGDATEGVESGRTTTPGTDLGARGGERQRRSSTSRVAALLVAAALVIAIAYGLIDRLGPTKRSLTVGEHTTMPVAPADAHVAPAISSKSIAVLPFADMSEKHDQEYFADGMAEEIIDRLTKLPELHVTARASSFYFKGKVAKIAEVGRELGVANVIEGSVRKAADHLRVTAQLIRTDSGFQVWSQTYDSQLKDVFGVQDQIASAVAGALQISLSGVPLTGERGGTRNIEAYQWYLRGKSSLYENSDPSLHAAKEALEKALKLDPGFGLASSRLAQVEILRTNNGIITSSEGYGHARALAHRALEVSPELAEPHMWLGYVYRSLDWNWSASAAEYERVLRDNPITRPTSMR